MTDRSCGFDNDFEVVAELLNRNQPTAPHVGDAGGGCAGKDSGRVVTTGNGRGEMKDVAIHQTGAVKISRDTGATLDQQLQHIFGSESIQ